MTSKIVFIFILILGGCRNKTSRIESSQIFKSRYNLVKHNLYIDKLTKELYFGYKIPYRILINNQDVLESYFVFDSTVILENEEIRLMSIVDTNTYSRSMGTDNYLDKNYYYNKLDINIKPKYEAIIRSK